MKRTLYGFESRLATIAEANPALSFGELTTGENRREHREAYLTERSGGRSRRYERASVLPATFPRQCGKNSPTPISKN